MYNLNTSIAQLKYICCTTYLLRLYDISTRFISFQLFHGKLPYYTYDVNVEPCFLHSHAPYQQKKKTAFVLDDVILLGDYIKAELNIQKLTVCADPAQYLPLLCAITAFPLPNLTHMTGSTCNSLVHTFGGKVMRDENTN